MIKGLSDNITTNPIFIESFNKQSKFDAIKWIISNNYQDDVIEFTKIFTQNYSTEQQYQLESDLVRYYRFDILLKLYQFGYNNGISKLEDNKNKRYNLCMLYYEAIDFKKYKLIKHLIRNNCYPHKLYIFCNDYFILKYIFKYLKHYKIKGKYLEFIDFSKPNFLELFVENDRFINTTNFIENLCNSFDLLKSIVCNNININYLHYINYAIDCNNKQILSILPLKYYIYI